MLTLCGTRVFVAETFGQWVYLPGYSGGLNVGMTTSKEQLADDDDGIARYIKGNSAGQESPIAIRNIPDDPGQEMLLWLGSHDRPGDGDGWVRIDLPGDVSLVMEGIFHGVTRLPIQGDSYQGFTVTFTQNEVEQEI